ncbi:delta(14)-sterol reductase LBR [Discoglossus pictus]
MPGRKFEDGETVMGRWPGSSLFYEVQVVTFDLPTQLYTVRYKDGTELEIKESDIKAINFFRAKKRSSVSPSRRRSRSRSRSPARSRSPGRAQKIAQPQSYQTNELKKGSVLQVHLTPLKLHDYNIGKINGRAEGVEKNTEHDKVTQFLKAEATTEEHADVLTKKYEKVLRYSLSPRKEAYTSKEILKKGKEDCTPKEILKKEVVKEPPVENKELEFGGNFGAAISIFFLPVFLFCLLFACSKTNANFFDFYQNLTVGDFLSYEVLGFFLLWIFLQVLFYMLPIGKIADGVPLVTDKQLKYRINGFYALLLTATVVGGALYYRINLLYVYDHYIQFVASATLFSIILSIYYFNVFSKVPNEKLSIAGSSGNFIYKFYMGRELNPRFGQFDIKYFSTIHAGLVGWVFINFIMLLTEMKRQNHDVPSISMILVNSFQLLYVIHALWNEERALASLDIVHDGFGFMTSFGNLVWVPFIYSLQAFYLVNHAVALSVPIAVAIVLLNIFGYVIFSGANNQKCAFRINPDDPKLAHLETITTSAGKKLLVSGWWGFVRHPNYLGDIIMAWAWCLPCGFTHIVPYFYGVFLTLLLVHRAARDERLCRRKYGLDWEKYCQRVPYRIFPYIY